MKNKYTERKQENNEPIYLNSMLISKWIVLRFSNSKYIPIKLHSAMQFLYCLNELHTKPQSSITPLITTYSKPRFSFAGIFI